jgi:predicted metal-dependent peptidase
MASGSLVRQISGFTAQRLAKARLTALIHTPYYAVILHSLTYVSTPGIGTIGIDDRLRLYIDEEAIKDWTVDELAIVLLHEVNHVLRGHSDRCHRIHADAELWNIAGDAEINDDLIQAGFRFPGEPITPEGLGLPEQQTVEFYYHALLNKENNSSTTQLFRKTCGSGADGQRHQWELGDVEGNLSGLSTHRVHAIREATAKEILSGKHWGLTPANLSRWAESFGRPQVPWRQLLHNAVRRGVLRRMGQVDYTWSRPNRRYQGKVLLPSLRSPLCNIAIIVDTSASMSQNDLNTAYTECRNLAVQSSESRVALISCDSAATLISEGRLPLTVNLSGGGGTDMQAGLDLASQLRRIPSVVIVLTDGETPWPNECPLRLRDATIVVCVVRSDVHFDLTSIPSWCTGIKIDSDSSL